MEELVVKTSCITSTKTMSYQVNSSSIKQLPTVKKKGEEERLAIAIYVDWLNTIEQVFDYYEVQMKGKLSWH